jgi:hypothetical protein
MNSSQNLDIRTVLDILEAQVLSYTGKRLTKAERIVIEGSWHGKDYKEIASDSGYSGYYLQQEVGPQLWTTLSKVIGNGVQVKKITLKNILLKVAKEHCIKLEASRLDDDCLVGKTRIYGDLPKAAFFYGRKKEIIDLKKQINFSKKSCIAITGIGGIGKSLLVAKVIEEILLEKSDAYEYIVWNTVTRYSSIDEVVTELISLFNLETEEETLLGKISLLSKHFHLHRCLLVLDGFEKVAQVESFKRRLEYEDFFVGITKGRHKSCILVTSQVPLKDIAYVTQSLPIESLRLEGLDSNAAMQMLRDKGLFGDECIQLIENYRGNPSELDTVAERINRIFGGNVQKFFDYETTVIGPRLKVMLNMQFGQAGFLSDLQKKIMIFLAEELSKDSTPIPFFKLVSGLKERLALKVSVSEVITAMEALDERSLIETSRKSSKQEICYSLEPVVKKYILVDALGLVYDKTSASQTSNAVQERM